MGCEVEQGEPDENGIPPYGQFIAKVDSASFTPFLTTVFADYESDTTSILSFSIKLIPNSLLMESFMILFVTQLGNEDYTGEYPLAILEKSGNRSGLAVYRAPDTTVWVSDSGKFNLFSIDTVGRFNIKATFEADLGFTELTDSDVLPDSSQTAALSSISPFFDELKPQFSFTKQDFIYLRQLEKRHKFASNLKKNVVSTEIKTIREGGFSLPFFKSEVTYSSQVDSL